MKKRTKRQLKALTKLTEIVMNDYLKSKEFKSNPARYLHVLGTLELHFRQMWLHLADLSEKGQLAPKASIMWLSKDDKQMRRAGLMTFKLEDHGVDRVKIKRIELRHVPNVESERLPS